MAVFNETTRDAGLGSVADRSTPNYRPLVSACAEYGIGRTTAFSLARRGLLKTATIGKRRYVYLDSLRTLPERLAAEAAK